MKNKLIPLALTIIGVTATPSFAQLVAESDQPIDITGDTAEFQDNLAVWTGNVRVLQGEGILTTDRLEADISEEGDFDNIRAIGSVRYSNGNEAITGERALFDNIARTITITENVIVTQGKQVMSAGAVTYWIDTGKVKFLPEPGKRIRGIFYTGSNEEQT
ncbi:MAG: LptA/OstA family protein [Pseudomonadota bacterium]